MVTVRFGFVAARLCGVEGCAVRECWLLVLVQLFVEAMVRL